MIKTTQQGKFGEAIALKYLQNRGYSLLHQNYYIRPGELDLIMQKNGIIVFVEVKLRLGKNFGSSAEALTANKKRKLIRAILTFLQTTQYHRWQLDFIAIDYNQPTKTAQIQHFSNVLELWSHLMFNAKFGYG